jgi:uncharacterized integral membrane protein
MSAPTPISEGSQRSQRKVDRRSRRERARTTMLVVLAVAITLFAVLNVDEVKVHYLVGTSKAPLIIVIVVSLLIGIVLTHFIDRRTGRRR